MRRERTPGVLGLGILLLLSAGCAGMARTRSASPHLIEDAPVILGDSEASPPIVDEHAADALAEADLFPEPGERTRQGRLGLLRYFPNLRDRFGPRPASEIGLETDLARAESDTWARQVPASERGEAGPEAPAVAERAPVRRFSARPPAFGAGLRSGEDDGLPTLPIGLALEVYPQTRDASGPEPEWAARRRLRQESGERLASLEMAPGDRGVSASSPPVLRASRTASSPSPAPRPAEGPEAPRPDRDRDQDSLVLAPPPLPAPNRGDPDADPVLAGRPRLGIRTETGATTGSPPAEVAPATFPPTYRDAPAGGRDAQIVAEEMDLFADPAASEAASRPRAGLLARSGLFRRVFQARGEGSGADPVGDDRAAQVSGRREQDDVPQGR